LNVKHLEIPKPLFPVNTTVTTHVKHPEAAHHHNPAPLVSKEPKQTLPSNAVTQPTEKAETTAAAPK